MTNENSYPSRIVCMTEESVEFFHGIGRSDVIAGVSAYAVRPSGVSQHPVVSAFTHANIKKITALNPDLILGFSDIQKDIAQELIGLGLDVYISNQRSIKDILRYLKVIGGMIGEQQKTEAYIASLLEKINYAKIEAKNFHFRPKVYIEEWNDPRICGIKWFSELVELCGGEDIFAEKSHFGSLAKDRFVSSEEIIKLNPDIILACWCGKKVDLNDFNLRVGWSTIKAVEMGQVFELAPEIFLQPGPAPILEGIDTLLNLFKQLNS